VGASKIDWFGSTILLRADDLAPGQRSLEFCNREDRFVLNLSELLLADTVATMWFKKVRHIRAGGDDAGLSGNRLP